MTTALTIGSACSGAGALDLAVERVFDATPRWFCEWEDAPSKVLAYHWPSIPNYRDLTAVDWSTVPAVDIFTAGYPCQPFSAAGKRKGTDDERHLWPFILVALNTLRPRWAVFENVAGHLTLGFDIVLRDLASHDWHVRWFVCKASDVGAPHHRKRVFILVSREPQPVPDGAREVARLECGAWTEPDAGLFGGIPFEGRWPRAGAVVDGIAYEVDAERAAQDIDTAGLLPTVQHVADGNGGLTEVVGVHLLPTPTTSEATGAGTRGGGKDLRTTLAANFPVLPTPNASDASGGGLHPDHPGRAGHTMQLPDYALLAADPERWGKYTPAINRWAHVLRRPAPDPTEPNRNGGPRLAARFAEWMMGWLRGWVTDPAIGLTRAEQLKIIGNGVVDLQAEHALRTMLSWCGARALTRFAGELVGQEVLS